MTVKELEFLTLETLKDIPMIGYQTTCKIKQCFNDYYYSNLNSNDKNETS